MAVYVSLPICCGHLRVCLCNAADEPPEIVIQVCDNIRLVTASSGTVTMSSNEDEGDGSSYLQNAKKRRIQRACDICRRKKSAYRCHILCMISSDYSSVSYVVRCKSATCIYIIGCWMVNVTLARRWQSDAWESMLKLHRIQL